MSKKDYGYIRVSTQEQNDDRQRIALEPFCIPPENLYWEKLSGKDFNRPAYKRLLRRIKPGDILHIKSIDRLGRSYNEIIEQWRFITREKGTDIKVVDMPLLDTTYCKDLLGTFISDLVLQVMSFSAQQERESLLQRQAEGIAAAKARGVVFGRKALGLPGNFEELVIRWRNGELSGTETAALCQCSLRTLYDRTVYLRKQTKLI
jgi:DNA invertase Pin-like site-specific DNA recombinase